MPGRVFVTGVSGFVGSQILKELLARGYAANAFTHRGRLPPSISVQPIQGDLFDATALDVGMRGCDAVIHLVGIIMEKPTKGITFERIHFEGTRAVVDAAQRNGIHRYIHMSALGTRPNAVSRYHQTKWEAEEYVRDSSLDWTIFRPALIHGPGGFMEMEAKWVRKKAPPFLVMPYFGKGLFGMNGSGLLQPVFVNDVARAFVDAIENPKSIHKTYDLVGPDRMSWPELHRIASREITGRQRLAAPLPAWLAKGLARAGLGSLLGFNRDQVIMSQEDNVGDGGPFEADFGWKTGGFASTLRTYAKQL